MATVKFLSNFFVCLLGCFLEQLPTYINAAKSDDYILIVYFILKHNLQAHMAFLLQTATFCTLIEIEPYTMRHCLFFFHFSTIGIQFHGVKFEMRGPLLTLGQFPKLQKLSVLLQTKTNKMSIQEECSVQSFISYTMQTPQSFETVWRQTFSYYVK